MAARRENSRTINSPPPPFPPTIHPPILTRYGHTLTPIGLHVLMFGGWDGTRASADVITLAFPSPPEMQENDAQGGGMAFDDGQFDYDDMGGQGQGQGQGQDIYDDGGAGGGGGY